MIALLEEICQLDVVERLYPSTSHGALCVKAEPGYNPDMEFFAVVALEDGSFRFKSYRRVGSPRWHRDVKPEHALSFFQQIGASLLSP
jgi:hypothetical protein